MPRNETTKLPFLKWIQRPSIIFNIVTHCANLSQPCTEMERSENAALLSSLAQVHITTPTRSIPEAPQIRISPYYGHTLVVPTVSAFPLCIHLGLHL